ncbi:CBS domain-containing protein [Streptomyces caeni]|uniref:CBS domain-containing protein n=1 Tax=Streptomyces caeni TaxID=2307231 RepID=A0ABW4ILM2_9ACTN
MPEPPCTVGDVMTHTVVTVGREAPVKETVQLIGRWKVSALPVPEGEGRVIGVVPEVDLLPKEEFRDAGYAGYADDYAGQPAERGKASALTAGELMGSPAMTVHADAALAEAARVMARRHVKRLLLADGTGLLGGVVTLGDILSDRTRVPDLARAMRAVEGITDIRLDPRHR